MNVRKTMSCCCSHGPVARVIAAGSLVGRITFALFFLTSFAVGNLRAAEVIPPKPVATSMITLASFQRTRRSVSMSNSPNSSVKHRTKSSSPFFRKMQTDSSIEDYTRRVAQAWGVGKKTARNGAVLFVFIEDRKDVHPGRLRSGRRPARR